MHAAVCDLPAVRQESNRAAALLAPYLRAWERHDVQLGIRSWDGWHLKDYAALFPAAMLEIPPHAFPSPSLVSRLRESVRGRLSLLVSDDMLVYRFPYGHPDPGCRGERNERFLEPDGLVERVFARLGEFGDRLGVVVLDIPRIYPTEGPVFGRVLSRLDRLLSALPRRWPLAVALHNGGYVLPDYLACLREHRVGHVLRSGRDMPPLLEQLPGMPEEGPLLIDLSAKALERELLGVAEAVRRSLERGMSLSVYAGDRPDERAMAVLLALMTVLNPELAKRSVLRRHAA